MAKLLVVDDEAAIRFTLGQVFSQDGVQVLEAENGRDALRIAAAELPDAVLLDIRLGGESGYDVYHRLRRIDCTSPVIFITGHGTADTAVEAMKLGAYDYLIKPLDLKQLQEVVSRALVSSHGTTASPCPPGQGQAEE